MLLENLLNSVLVLTRHVESSNIMISYRVSYINDRRGKTYTYFLYTLQMRGQSITSGSKMGAGLIEENKNNKDGFYRDFKSRTLFPKFRR